MILIIDDDIAIRSSLSLFLESEGFVTCQAEKEGPALKELNTKKISLIIMDMNFSPQTTGEEGLALLEDVKKYWPKIPVILITGWGSIELAVKGMKLGAYDFISKPWSNDLLLKSVKTAYKLQDSNDKANTSRKELDQKFSFENIIGKDKSIIDLLNTISRVADTDAPVLIEGESGTGKELIAEAIHSNIHRKNSPFVKVNMGAITSSLFESEMFGHKKGAFTDAIRDRKGRFLLANGGTLFLDELGELDLTSQVKLLRVLQEKQFEPVGGSETITSDFRIVCATNKSLQTMVEKGTFREDLFYRINLISLKVPALRERSADIAILADHFLGLTGQLYKREGIKMDETAYAYLKKQSFSGNIRELKNLIERVVLVSAKKILSKEDFEQCYSSNTIQKTALELPETGRVTLDAMEKAMIQKALQDHPNNLSKVARLLGLTRGQLYRRLEKYHLEYEK